MLKNGKVHRFRCRYHGYHNLIAKQITNDFLSDEEVIWKNLKHNHIVSLFAIKKGIKTTTFLMEDCPLSDLLQVMKNRRVLYSDDEVRVIVRRLLQALSYLHKWSIVHLDVKSNNISMLKNGWIKLGDFGHAKYYHPENNATNVCGTLSFAAPEIFDNNFSPKSDIWSVGVTIFNLLTGIYPFEHEETSNPNITIARILASCYDELENITPQQGALFKRLFKINSDERPTALRFLYTDEWVISPSEFSRSHGNRHELNFRTGRLSVYSPSIPYRNVVINSSTPAAE